MTPEEKLQNVECARLKERLCDSIVECDKLRKRNRQLEDALEEHAKQLEKRCAEIQEITKQRDENQEAYLSKVDEKYAAVNMLSALKKIGF